MGDENPVMPSTRYQGSKRKVVDSIGAEFDKLDFETALDLMGGTATVSFELKKSGKSVTYNDLLKFNYHIGRALIENNETLLAEKDIEAIFNKRKDFQYDDLVQRIYHDILFSPEENVIIDFVSQNISQMNDSIKQSMAYFCLCQVLIMKRPYNLFHRANYYMRTADVERSFGNKATWEKPIKETFEEVAAELNAAIFSNGKENTSLNLDCQDVQSGHDLVYIDSPYINGKGTGVDYADFYNFLDGVCDYSNWEKKIDFNYKHRPLEKKKNPWCNPKQIKEQFRSLFEKHNGSIIVVSYRRDGIPSIGEIRKLLKEQKKTVSVKYISKNQYALSPNKKATEVLIIGQ
jgi:adenine-specific DNA methylase